MSSPRNENIIDAPKNIKPTLPFVKSSLISMQKEQLIDLVEELESKNKICERIIQLYQKRLFFYKKLNKQLSTMNPISETNVSAKRLTNLK